VTSPNFSNGVTTFAATAIVIADMVGVGVFTSLGFQVQTIDSGFSLILLWVVGGIVAFCRATCYDSTQLRWQLLSGFYGALACSLRTYRGYRWHVYLRRR
jgi:basic amino acid/polyamine antiporter, APA family